MTSVMAPSLHVKTNFEAAFRALDATSVETVDPSTVRVSFTTGHDEAAFNQFVRDEVHGAKLVTDAQVYDRCLPPQWDVERAVSYLGKAPGVTGVDFIVGEGGGSGQLQVHASNEAAASTLQAILRDEVELPGSGITATINVAPGEG